MVAMRADECLSRIARMNAALNAFVEFGLVSPPTSASGPLAGLPIALKDNIDLFGSRVGVGAPMFAHRRAASTATAVTRLLEAGVVIIGRTRMVELAFGGWGINHALGTPRNPWDAASVRVPGGSSSGSAVAVAAGLVPAALGTDTAGSIRMPAALCGVTGYKPSFGAIPLDGVFPLAPSYDSIGPIARHAADCAALFEVMAATRLPLQPGMAGWRIARLDVAAYPVPVEPAVQHALDEAAAVFARLGATLIDAAAPFAIDRLTRDAGILIAAEAWQVHRQAFETNAAAFGADMQRRMALARAMDASTIIDARQARIQARDLFQDWMREYDALLLPTVPCAAPRLDRVDEAGSPLSQFTRWVNHVGGCAISLPAGFDESGLPAAIQLVGGNGADARLLSLGRAFQEVTDWHLREPELRWAGE
jgi:aspartyl-tRNA(Asn)/glutamyl-tRNA(Gln) amidotransferase subunit A